VDQQRANLEEIVQTRRAISVELRRFMKEESVDQDKVLVLAIMPLENSLSRDSRPELFSRHFGTPLAQAADAQALCPAKANPSSATLPASTPATATSASAPRLPGGV